jgi:hypothetical protein
MCAEERKSLKGNVMYWAAIGLMLLSILCNGHGRLHNFVTGAAGAIFTLAIVEMVRRQRSCIG